MQLTNNENYVRGILRDRASEGAWEQTTRDAVVRVRLESHPHVKRRSANLAARHDACAPLWPVTVPLNLAKNDENIIRRLFITDS